MGANDQVSTKMCSAEISAVLEKYNLQMCVLDLMINGKHVYHEVRVVPKVPMTAQIQLVPNQ